MDGPLLPLPQLTLEGVSREEVQPIKIVGEWLSSLEKVFEGGSSSELFIEDCWWRDLLALSWDIHTKKGQTAIAEYLKAGKLSKLAPVQGPLGPKLSDMGGMIWIESGFSFETPNGFGRGLVRLAHIGSWKAWTVFTRLEKLHGQDELEASRTRDLTASTRFSEKKGDEDLQVVVVGAGQCGLAMAAELQNMGLETLIVDKASQIGATWRSRYNTVTLHTARHSDHYPFLKYPENWPTWLHQDKVTSWMDHYAAIMGLKVKLNTTVKSVTYEPEHKRWRVETNGETLRPRHVVMATGLVSSVPKIPQFPGTFDGTRYHSIEHKSATQIPDLANKKVAIIGSGTSAHDIAQDFVNSGAKEVTLLQRGPIFSVSSQSVENFFFAPFKALPTEDADMMFNSFPLSVMRTLNLGVTQMIAQNDKEMLDKLTAAGQLLKRGDDGVSLLDYQMNKFGHFYIDQGACEMIIDGRIKIKRCEGGVKEFYPKGLEFADGTKLDADVVILATGLEPGNVALQNVIGKELFDRLEGFGTLDKEAERVGWWRPTALPGLWNIVGNFMWSRQFSRILALQIGAIEKGVNKSYYDAYETK